MRIIYIILGLFLIIISPNRTKEVSNLKLEKAILKDGVINLSLVLNSEKNFFTYQEGGVNFSNNDISNSRLNGEFIIKAVDSESNNILPKFTSFPFEMKQNDLKQMEEAEKNDSLNGIIVEAEHKFRIKLPHGIGVKDLQNSGSLFHLKRYAKKGKEIFIQVIYKQDSLEISKVITKEKLKLLKEQNISIFNGSLMSNKLPLYVD